MTNLDPSGDGFQWSLFVALCRSMFGLVFVSGSTCAQMVQTLNGMGSQIGSKSAMPRRVESYHKWESSDLISERKQKYGGKKAGQIHEFRGKDSGSKHPHLAPIVRILVTQYASGFLVIHYMCPFYAHQTTADTTPFLFLDHFASLSTFLLPSPTLLPAPWAISETNKVAAATAALSTRPETAPQPSCFRTRTKRQAIDAPGKKGERKMN